MNDNLIPSINVYADRKYALLAQLVKAASKENIFGSARATQENKGRHSWWEGRTDGTCNLFVLFLLGILEFKGEQ